MNVFKEPFVFQFAKIHFIRRRPSPSAVHVAQPAAVRFNDPPYYLNQFRLVHTLYKFPIILCDSQ